MAVNKGGRNGKRRMSGRRSSAPSITSGELFCLERLESRRMMDVGIGYNTITQPPTWHATNNNISDLHNGPMANAGQYLVSIYQQYQAYLTSYNGNSSAPPFSSSYSNMIEFNGSYVGVRVNTWGDINSAKTALTNIGMSIQGEDSTYGIFEGWVPINELPIVAQMPMTISLSPIYKPTLNYSGYQGVAYNEALTTMQADTASNQFNVDGTGVTVGVISDSVSQYAGGLADSYKTGDLPQGSPGPVNVLLDGPSGSTDEGRAMLENVHDVAPGAGLAFSTGEGGDTGFAQSIINLATEARAQIIVDDLGYSDEPFFQSGIIGQAIEQVVSQNNVSYFSAAGNTGLDEGYLSAFRGATATVAGVGTGTFMNFNPNGQVTALLPVTTANGSNGFPISATNPAAIAFQFDQPWYTSNGVTSELNFYILNSSGTIIASGTTDNTATQQPIQSVQVGTAGNYFVAIQLVKGPAPNYVEFLNQNENATLNVSTQFGSAGTTSYPSTYGHSAIAATIGVGAMPWWGAQPWLNVPQINSESFSAPGPALFDISSTGSYVTPTIVQNPTITAPDGGNTSFFSPGNIINTTNTPPFAPGEPSTPTNLSQNLPSFFGTSSAAPNAAAVAAMMKELVPQATEAQIKAALIAGALPMNGTPQGTWNTQSGYGLVNAVNALNALDQLRVTSTTPANGSTVNTAINSITFNFNKDVNFSSVAASDLTFSTLPPGVTVTVGAPIQNSTTSVTFPIAFNFPIGLTANGSYAYTLAGPIVATDGKTLIPDAGSFTLADTLEPTITNTTFTGRMITIAFSSAIRQATLTADSFQNGTLVPGSVRLGVTPTGSSTTSYVIPTNFTYNIQTNVLTIDLTGVPQSQLPSGAYTLSVSHTVTDTIGNGLNGQFNGTFPSGVPDSKTPSDFIQVQNFTLTAPQITFFALTPASDTGIPNDSNTKLTQPTYIGQVTSSFPAAVGGLTILAEWNAFHGGSLDLQVGPGGRGYSGNFDLQAVTNSQGTFTFQAPAALVDGLNNMAVLVIGAQDVSGQSGLSSLVHYQFRVDTTDPSITGSNLVSGSYVNTLTSVTFNVTDPVGGTGAFAVPTNLNYPALDPNTADNTSNYTLTNTATNKDYSSFITSANFTATTSRLATSDPYTGTVTLALAPGLPQGSYTLVAHTTEGTYTGLTDAAGNPLSADFSVSFNLQPTPVYIQTLTANSTLPDGSSATIGLAKSFYEQSAPSNVVARDDAPAPPSSISIVLSNPLLTDTQRTAMGLATYANSIQLLVSPNGGTYTAVSGITISLVNSVAGATPGQPGYNNELVLTLPAVLASGTYKISIPNTGNQEIVDAFGNQLDGEFLGNLTTTNPVVQVGDVPEPGSVYADLITSTGQVRANDMSGDGRAGGSFLAGFQIVPYGNVIFARPDYNYSPLGGPDYPDGTPAKPFPTLAAEAVANALNQGNLNSSINYTNFNPALDFNGDGHFDPSAFYAASTVSNAGPVVIVALPGVLQTNPITGVQSQASFVLQAPIGSDGSASVPFNTTLLMTPDSTLKLQNAALLVQNQNTALEVLGGPTSSQVVNFTSYADHSIGNSGSSSDSTPRSGDWGGIVFRNFDQVNQPGVSFPVDGSLKGPQNPSNPSGPPLLASSGENDLISMIDYANVAYGGGAVPATVGFRYDAVTLFASRPTLTNDVFAHNGDPATGASSAQAAISANFDSLLADATAQGPLVRNATFLSNGINGIWLRPELSGLAEATNAMPFVPTAPDGVLNYVLNNPYPYLLTSEVYVGQVLDLSNGNTASTPYRLYVNPGMMVKSIRGAGIRVLAGASINVGDRTYMDGFDANPEYAPVTNNGQPNTAFKTPNVNVASIMFTSAYDNLASTSYTDPTTGLTTIITAASDVLNSGGVNQPTATSVPTAARWGSLLVESTAVAVITGATFQYGGGEVNFAGNTIPSNNVLSFLFAGPGTGTNAYVTNNNFNYNLDAPIAVTPDGLPATDPLRPLLSGNPFIHGNVLIGNGINGLAVLANAGYSPTGPVEGILPNGAANLHNNSVWDLTDITYVLRGTIVVGPDGTSAPPLPGPNPTQFTAIPTPNVTLTIQSQLGGTLLADGTTIPAPGQSVVVKLLNQTGVPGNGTTGSTGSSESGGAGFLVGVDDGIDPPANSPWFDPGYWSSIRITGIAGNETTHQARVPVVITSIYDNTVGTTARGVYTNQIIPGATQAPTAGDGGLIYFGGNSMGSYNPYDPRQGNLIDNADIRYITRIEQQAGGIVQVINWLGVNSAPSTSNYFSAESYGINPFTGAVVPIGQYDVPKLLPVTDSNLSNFSTAGILVHPNAGLLVENTPGAPGYNLGSPPVYRYTGLQGEPAYLYTSNDTIVDMGTSGVRIVGFQSSNDNQQQSPFFATFLNDTFYNDNVAIQTLEPTWTPNPNNDLSYIDFIAMDSIFSNNATAAIQTVGMVAGSLAQYDLFWQNGTDVSNTNPGSDLGSWAGNNNPINGNPQFVNAGGLNFNLQANSAAIDSSMSEYGPDLVASMLQPAATQSLNAAAGIRNTTGMLGQFAPLVPQDLVTLAGYPLRGFADQWVAALPGSPGAYEGPASNIDTFWYLPIAGERDLLGNLRQKDPNSTNIGFGSRPYFDIGAYEYRQFFPPQVTAVNANIGTDLSPTITNIYSVGGIGGSTTEPQNIQITFNHQLDPTTISGLSVLLAASGNDGIFGNNNSPADTFINLAGKLSFDPSTDILTIHLADQGLVLPDDEYRVILEGTGSNVLRDPQGNALDGANLDSSGNQTALPSGTGVPGSNFQVTFTIGQPAIEGHFVLAAASDSNQRDGITNDVLPTFTGTVVDPFLGNKPLPGQTVVVDVSTAGNGVFDQVAVGTAVTDANGNFSINVTTPLKNSPYAVGADGTLDPLYSVDSKGNVIINTQSQDTGYSIARVRVVDSSGNTISDPTASNAQIPIIVDTNAPVITQVTPAAGSQATVNSNGQVGVSVTFNKGIYLPSISTSSIELIGSGGDGIFGNGNDSTVPIDLTNTGVSLTHNALGGLTLTFFLPANLPNDLYELVFKGTGAKPIIDIAGNALDGAKNGQAGSDLIDTFLVFSSTSTHLIYVGPASFVSSTSATQGTRENPFPTIAAGLATAKIGDTVAVLPGVYTDTTNPTVMLKDLVNLVSASPASTDTSLVHGNALQTVIRSPSQTSTAIPIPAVLAYNLPAIAGVPTTVEGFTLASSLFGNPAIGTINPSGIGFLDVNSAVTFEKNYVIDNGIGVQVNLASGAAVTPTIETNVIAGNLTGLQINSSSTTSANAQLGVLNNDLVFNTYGMTVLGSASNPADLVLFANNIVAANHDLTTSRTGVGIYSNVPGIVQPYYNLFQSNGASDTNPAYAGVGIGNGFNAGSLSASPDSMGNIAGAPAFAFSVDPRPNADGPGRFFNDANFDLTLPSAAINTALEQTAPATDIIFRSPVAIPGRGRSDSGPADIGAFYFQGSSTSTLAITSTSLAPGGQMFANGFAISTAPTSIVVHFSQNVNEASVTAGDLVLSGTGLAPSDPAHAVSLDWIDPETVQFNLSGQFANSGTVQLSIAADAFRSATNVPVSSFQDSVTVAIPTPPPTGGSIGSVGGATTPIPATPPAAAPPVSVGKHKPRFKFFKHHGASAGRVHQSLTHKETHPAAKRPAQGNTTLELGHKNKKG